MAAAKAKAAIGTPAILKTRRFGYDGKGQARIMTPGDAVELSHQMHELLGQPDMRQRMGQAGLGLVRDEFSIEAMVQGNLSMYRSLTTLQTAQSKP